jgi:hypothetical protein
MSQPSSALSALREELVKTHHTGRLRRMLDLGRQARSDKGALALIDELGRGDVFERRMALFAQHTLRDGKRLLPFTEDVSRSLRSLSFTLVPRVCEDPEALEALKVAYALRRDRDLLRQLSARGRRAVVDRYLDWLATRPGLHDFADLVPMASPEGVRRHLDRALERPSHVFWDRLARSAPDALGMILAERLRAVPDEPDPVTRQLIEKHTAQIARRAPDEGLALIELLVARGIMSKVSLLTDLGATRPAATLALIERYDLRVGGGPFAKSADAFDAETLARIVRRDPWLLGDAKKLAERLPAEKIRALTVAWCDVLLQQPVWGFALLGRLEDAALRRQAWERWSVAARNADGVIAVEYVRELPEDVRELEARRHLDDVVALGTRPGERIRYARFLPWDEAEAAIRAYLGHPEGGMRGAALSVLLAIPGLRPKETALADKALAMVLARKNEQDPVRMAMLYALVAWPRSLWRKDHVTAIGQILRDALDAGDLSHSTAQQAEALLIRAFRLDPAWAAGWLATFIKERGNLYDGRLGLHLDDDEVRAAAPHLLAVAKTWSSRERIGSLFQLAESLGKRLDLVPGLPELLERAMREAAWGGHAYYILELFARFDRPRYEALLAATLRQWLDRGWQDEVLRLAARPDKPGKRQPPVHPEIAAALEKIARGHGRNEHVVSAVTLLRTRATAHFDRILADLLAKDESYVCIPVVHWHMHKRRQDLLGPFLGMRVIHGRFATGRTAWLLPFRNGFHRWTVAQNVTFAESLAAVVRDQDRDTPTVWSCLAILAAMDSAPMDALAALAGDKRAAVQDRAIRTMARCDRGQCVPTLLRCLEDARARIAIYGLRKAVKDMLPARAIDVLGGVPMAKVTVAKEVLRLLGELRADAAYDRLIALDGTNLHRDVRIALLRALWDHLDREPTWGVFYRAVNGADWVMASRLGDIPADRLTKTTDRRLSALLARVLGRPEPEARIDLLQRAAMLSVSDPEGAFLTACASRLISVYDDEVRAAMMAIMHRSTEADLTRLPTLLAVAMDDPRCLHVAVSALLSVYVKSRASWIGAARAAARVLARDLRWAALRVRCAAAAMEAGELADYLAELGEAGALSSDALEACRAAVDALPVTDLLAFVDRLRASESPEARRVAVWALVRDAGPNRGWAPERLERLAALQSDPSPLVAGAAQAVFPPREMVKKGGRTAEKST